MELTEPLLLHICPVGVAHARVVGGGRDPSLQQDLRHLLAILAGETVHDTGLSAELSSDQLQDLLAGSAGPLAPDLVLEISPVAGPHEPTEIGTVRDHG